MSDPSKIAKNLQAFRIGVNVHDRENPTHTAYGIGLAHFDMERLGFDEGEEVLPGITIHADGGETGNFRVLCDGDHVEQLEAEEAETIDAVSTRQTSVPVGAPGDGERRGGEEPRQASPSAIDCALGGCSRPFQRTKGELSTWLVARTSCSQFWRWSSFW